MAGRFSEGPYDPTAGTGGWLSPEPDHTPALDIESDPSEASSEDEGPYGSAPTGEHYAHQDPDAYYPMGDQHVEAVAPDGAAAVGGQEPVQAPADAVFQDAVGEVMEEVPELEEEFMVVEDSEPESTVEYTYPIRRHDAPLPPPSFQVYRHPGGSLWMHTPRKRVPPVRRPISYSLSLSTQEIIPWIFDGAGTSAEGAYARTDAARVHREDPDVSAMRRMMDPGPDTPVSAAQYRRLSSDFAAQGVTLAKLQEELAHTRGRMSRLEGGVSEAARMARQALEEDRAFRRRLAQFYQFPWG